MLEITTQMRNTFVIGLLIVAFLFFMVHAWMYRDSPLEAFSTATPEYFDCDALQKKIDSGRFEGTVLSLIPTTPVLLGENQHKWFNRFDVEVMNDDWMTGAGRGITFEAKDAVDMFTRQQKLEVKPGTSKFIRTRDIKDQNGNALQTDYMTLSFWIYIDRGADWWRPIVQFGNIQENWWLSERSPGVWLWPWNRNALHIRRSTDSPKFTWHLHENAGGDFFTDTLNNIPLQKPSYCTIVFSSKTYKMYLNGVHIQTWENMYEHRPSKELYLWVGGWKGDNSYSLRKMEIFATPLTDDEVKLLYCKNKQMSMDDREFTNIRREGFQSIRPTKSLTYKEAFQGNHPTNEVDMFGDHMKWKSDVVSAQIPGQPAAAAAGSDAGSEAGSSNVGPGSQQDTSIASSEEIANAARVEEKPIAAGVPKTTANGMTMHSVRLDNMHFPKLAAPKVLHYVHLDSKKKQYLEWTKDFDLSDATGLTFAMWYRPSAMTASAVDHKHIDEQYNKAINVEKGKPGWQDNVNKHMNEAWFPQKNSEQYHSPHNNGYWARLFDFGNGPGKENILTALLDKSIVIHAHTSVGWAGENYITPMVAEGNHWYHFAVTMTKEDAGKSTWKIYHNGALSGAPRYNKYFPDAVERKGKFIGKSHWSRDPYYDGGIGDFRIYKTALTDDQVVGVMNNTFDPNSNLESDNKLGGASYFKGF